MPPYAVAILYSLVGGLGGGLLVGLFIYMFKESIKSALARSLTTQAERLKHDLQREMLKAQLSATERHSTYPVLLAKLHRANGALAELTKRLPWPNEIEKRDEFTRHLLELKLPHDEYDQILQASNELYGQLMLQNADRRSQTQRARLLVERARNFTVLKSLLLSEEVEKLSLRICDSLMSGWTLLDWASQSDREDAQRLRFKKLARYELAFATTSLRDLEKLMREEITPRAAD